VAETAEVLGIEVDDVVEGLEDGKSLAQIAEEHGVSAEEYKTALTDAVEDKLADAVANGRITQERADEMLAKFTENADRIINHVPDEDGPRPCRRMVRGGVDPANVPSQEAEGRGL
jgi:hypothetical protein